MKFTLTSLLIGVTAAFAAEEAAPVSEEQTERELGYAPPSYPTYGPNCYEVCYEGGGSKGGKGGKSGSYYGGDYYGGKGGKGSGYYGFEECEVICDNGPVHYPEMPPYYPPSHPVCDPSPYCYGGNCCYESNCYEVCGEVSGGKGGKSGSYYGGKGGKGFYYDDYAMDDTVGFESGDNYGYAYGGDMYGDDGYGGKGGKGGYYGGKGGKSGYYGFEECETICDGPELYPHY